MEIINIIMAHIASRLTKGEFPIKTLVQWKSLDIHQRRKLLSFGFGFFDRCHDCKIPFTYKVFKEAPSGLLYHKGFAHGTYRMDSWFEPSDGLVVKIIGHPDEFLNLDEKLDSLKTRIFKPRQSRNAKMTLDKEDQAVIRGIVRNETIPPHNELLKKISDLEDEVKTPRAQLQKYEPAPVIPAAPVVEPPVGKSRPKRAPEHGNPHAASRILPRLREFFEKKYLTAAECNRIEGILTDVPGRLSDPKASVTRYEAFEHRRERREIAALTMAEAKSRGLALSEREWSWLVRMYKESDAA